MIQRFNQYLGRLFTEPTEQLSHIQRTARFAIDLTRHCAAELRRDQASQMAAALTYRTIFSLVPLAVLMLLVFRAFGGFEQVRDDLETHLYDYLGLSSIALPADPSPDHATPATRPADSPATTSLDPQPPPRGQAVRANIQRVLTDLTDRATQASAGSIGAVGLALLIWAALALLVTVEQSFNQVYNCPTGRPWHLRVLIYWAVITLGPFLLFVSLYVAERLMSSLTKLDASGLLTGVIGSLGGATALAASWLLLDVLYVLMPNTPVRQRSALIGAFVAAVLWESAKWGFKLYVSKMVPYSALYGTLGLLPLFLFWVYTGWLIVLFGLELTYTLDAMHDNRFEDQKRVLEQRPGLDPQGLIAVLTGIGRSFARGQVITAQALAHESGLPLRTVHQITNVFQHEGWVHFTQPSGSSPSGYSLAKPPRQIPLARLVDLGRPTVVADMADIATDARRPESSISEKILQAQRQAVGTSSLATILQESDPSPS